VTVTNVQGGSGSLKLQVLAGAATDKAGNASVAMTSAPVNVVGVKKLLVGFVTPPLRSLPGKYATYRIAYKNAGNQIDSGAAIIVTLPGTASFNAAASTPGWTAIGGGRYRL